MNTQNVICGYEYEVVRWIRNNYKMLGYDKILSENKDKVPDFIMIKNNRKLRVEVEIYSNSFIKHKHNPKDVDEVLCVIDNCKLPIKTSTIKQLKLWYQLQGDELVDFFKAMPDALLIDHRCGQTIHHFQEDWINLSEKKEKAIRKNLIAQSKFLNSGDPKILKEKVGNVFD